MKEELTELELKAKLYKKIHAVMCSIQYLSKDFHVKYLKTDYKAISEEKVTMVVRNSLIKNGLVMIPVETTMRKDGNLTSVTTSYHLGDIDTGHCETITSCGQGADSQDKGSGKAMTYAFKYALLRAFAIPTGDDPDKISSAELDSRQNDLASEKQVGLIKVLYSKAINNEDMTPVLANACENASKLKIDQASKAIEMLKNILE